MVKKEILLTQQSAINYLEYSKADYFNLVKNQLESGN